jgi:hypothetical protein
MRTLISYVRIGIISYSFHTALKILNFQQIFVTLKDVLTFSNIPYHLRLEKKKKRITHITKQAFSQNGIAVKVEREIKNKTCFCKFNYA